MKKLNCQALVVGSGPGGQITAHRLLEAGLDVIVIEHGPRRTEVGNPTRHSWQEICQLYAGGGAIPALGKHSVAVSEAFCAGGGSEINAGLYWRLPETVRSEWESELGLPDFSPDALNTIYSKIENNIVFKQNAEKGISKRLTVGAAAANLSYAPARKIAAVEWKTSENFFSKSSIIKFFKKGNKIVSAIARTPEGQLSIDFDHLFLCAGATGTPRILQQKKLSGNAGKNIKFHAMMKITAEFKEPINDLIPEVESGQATSVSQSNTVFGCSLSSPGFLVASLAEHGHIAAIEELKYFAQYNIHTSVVGNLALGRFGDPILISKLQNSDITKLEQDLEKLKLCLTSAGAKRFFEPQKESPARITALHLFGGCALGGDIADVFGQVKSLSNVRINDASLIPLSPIVNPQGTLMAIAWRNMDHFISEIL